MVSVETVTVTKTLGFKEVPTQAQHGFAADNKRCCKFTLDDDNAVISKLTVRLDVAIGDSIDIKGVIYSDSSGVPDALLATTGEETFTGNVETLVDLTFAAPVELDAGDYWFGHIHSGDDILARYSAGATNQTAYNADVYAGGAADPFGAPSYFARKYVIWATYTVEHPFRYPPTVEGYTIVSTLERSKGVRWQEKSFYAQGRMWAFWIEYVASGNYKAYYSSSADFGVTWEPKTEYGPTRESYGECLQAILEKDTNYVHVFRRAGTPTKIYYRRGEVASDGSITWTAADAIAWQCAVSANVDFYGALDSNGYPYISWGYGADLTHIDIYVTKSDDNTGVWSTEGGYPVRVSDGVDFYVNNWIAQLKNGKMYVFYFNSKYDGKVDEYQVKGRLWNTNTWGAEETVTTNYIVYQYTTARESWSRGSVVDDDDTIHLAFLTPSHTGNPATYLFFSWDIRYVSRTMTAGWGSETVVEENILAKNAGPGLTLQNDILRFFWIGGDADNVIFSKRLDSDGWWEKTIWFVDETEDKIPNTYAAGYDGMINPFVQLYDNKFGLLYITNDTGGKFKLKFALERFTGEFTENKINRTAYNAVKRVFTAQKGTPSVEVTREALSLGTRDSTTGWYEKNYAFSTIEMFVVDKGQRSLLMPFGYTIQLDGLGITMAYVREYDVINDGAGRSWLVKAVRPQLIGDVLLLYNVDLEEKPFHGF